ARPACRVTGAIGTAGADASSGAAAADAARAPGDLAVRRISVRHGPGLRAQVLPLRLRRGSRERRSVRAAAGGVRAMMPAPAMLRIASIRGWRCRAAVLAASLLCVLSAHAQDVTEPSLKAAFIYNFAKFTEWPADGLPVTAPFNACVLGDPAIGDALERSVKNRLLSGHAISVLRVQIDGPLRTCHLL